LKLSHISAEGMTTVSRSGGTGSTGLPETSSGAVHWIEGCASLPDAQDLK